MCAGRYVALSRDRCRAICMIGRQDSDLAPIRVQSQEEVLEPSEISVGKFLSIYR